MNTFTILNLLAVIVYLTVAAAVPGYTGAAPSIVGRVESTFAWKDHFVRNCTTPLLWVADDDNGVIDGDHCKNVSTWQNNNNGGYYELWDFSHFNNYTYRPIVGHDTCVVALNHVEKEIANDYAVVGSLDVIDLVTTAVSRFQVDGKLPTIQGFFTCGPNRSPLNILIYNGRTGWQDTYYSAAPTSMNGPAIGSSYATGSPPRMPVVSALPEDPTSGR